MNTIYSSNRRIKISFPWHHLINKTNNSYNLIYYHVQIIDISRIIKIKFHLLHPSSQYRILLHNTHKNTSNKSTVLSNTLKGSLTRHKALRYFVFPLISDRNSISFASVVPNFFSLFTASQFFVFAPTCQRFCYNTVNTKEKPPDRKPFLTMTGQQIIDDMRNQCRKNIWSQKRHLLSVFRLDLWIFSHIVHWKTLHIKSIIKDTIEKLKRLVSSSEVYAILTPINGKYMGDHASLGDYNVCGVNEISCIKNLLIFIFKNRYLDT